MKKYKLRRIDAAARKRFEDGFVLVAFGKRLDPYTCKRGGWRLTRKGETKPVFEHEAPAKKQSCFRVRGGYVHASGKRALVKLTESWFDGADDDEASSSSTDATSYELVELSK